MPHRRRAGAWLLALAHLLTTTLVDLGHQHGPPADESVRCASSCRAPGAHLSGHKSPDLTKAHRDCPACGHRVVPVAASEPTGVAHAPRVETLARRDPPRASRRFARPSTVRGPPAPACA